MISHSEEKLTLIATRNTFGLRDDKMPQHTKRYEVVHVISGLARESGGPSRSVPALCKALAARGTLTYLISVTNSKKGTVLESARNVHTSFYPQLGFRSAAFAPNLEKALQQKVKRENHAHIIHSHGLWQWPCYAAAKVANMTACAHLISPCGMLEPWSLAHSRWKKRVAWWLFQNRNLKGAACLHAMAEQEARNIRNLGFRNPIAVIPIGLDVSTYYTSTRKDEIENKWKSLKGKRLLLFISRMHPVKGLLNLAKAWGDLFKNYPDWHLVIAGPDSGGHTRQVRSAITAIGAENATTFTGPVYGDVKRKLYASCDIFVLPTFSENFGIVIAEALASGKPVITTKGTPWSELEKHDCGWYIDTGVGPLREALREAMSSSDSKRAEMGKRGRALIKEKYSWPKIAGQMIDVYKWLLGKGNKPDCVKLD